MAEPMPREAGLSLPELRTPRLELPARPALWRSLRTWRWEPAVAGLAVVGAIAALWITLRAHFLAHPGWLAVQKADFILGPIGVGLYWHHRRPRNRLGLLLIALGLLGLLYIGGSIRSSVPFGLGVYWEVPMVLLTEAVILAFPSGRLDGRAERWILAFSLLTLLPFRTAIWVTSPHAAPWFSISECRIVCPANGAAIWSPPSWAPQLVDAMRASVIVMALSTAALLVWRFITGSPPRRRALAIGAPIALLYLFLQGLYQVLQLSTPANASAASEPIKGVIDWAFAGARSALWYGFLFALIAAELFAGRVLKAVVRGSLRRPSLGELERMLREPLGDPGLRLGFWRASSRDWVGHGGGVLEPPKPGQRLIEVDRGGRPAAAIVHDAQLSEDPELLQAAGAAALLAQENAELDAAWKRSLGELADSRARLASASDRERRKLERDLHDGAQQRLVAATINLTLAEEAGDEQEHYDRIADARAEIEQALIELREVAHGIYPTALSRSGLGRAFNWLVGRYPAELTIAETTDERFSPAIELAVYYCGLEAVQNVSKHAGPRAHIWIRVYVEADELHLEVRDDGRGFDVARARDSIGLRNMSDRLGAVGGRVDVISEPGKGTIVAASVPASTTPDEPDRTHEPPGQFLTRS
jgi:signal transduction histidine kinase